MGTDDKNIWQRLFNPVRSGDLPDSARKPVFSLAEKIFVFLIAFIIAVALWFVVNIGRVFSLTINLPLYISQPESEYAMAQEPPEDITVSLYGQGWKLLSLYNTTQDIVINPVPGTINLNELVQQQLATSPDVTIRNVQPEQLSLNIEERITRTVPVHADVDVTFRRQHSFVNHPTVRPDSVTISGASSLIQSIDELTTETYQASDVNEDIVADLEINKPSRLLTVEPATVELRANVIEYTESEVRLIVRLRGNPEDQEIRFSPSVVTVRYDVPIEHFSITQEELPYEAFVYYLDIRQDTTGTISPVITSTMSDIDLRLRGYSPRRIRYFEVVEE